jgi:hypothetical protein
MRPRHNLVCIVTGWNEIPRDTVGLEGGKFWKQPGGFAEELFVLSLDFPRGSAVAFRP